MSYTSGRVVYRNAWGIQPMQEDKMRSLGFVFNDIRDAMPHQIVLPIGWTIIGKSPNQKIVDKYGTKRAHIEETMSGPDECKTAIYVLLKLT